MNELPLRNQTKVGSEPNAYSLDRLLELLSNNRRRYALYCLSDHATSIALADLADEVAVMEEQTKLTEVSAKEVKQIYLSLYHTHVPKLQDEGFVVYNQDQDTVGLEERGEEALPLLERIQSIE